ncbi:MAG TPA: lantibiotic dehydratase, partial [Longimicrobiaceae bacterium]
RYFTRTAMKATPFGTLCAVVPGAFAPPAAGGAGIGLGGDPLPKRSLARLNKQLYGIITRFLSTQRSIRPHLHVELNPTVGEEGEQLVYLAVHHGREAFQRLAKNPVLDLIAATVAERVHLPLRELARVLAGHPDVEASEEEATKYVERLVDAGLLRVRFGIREQEVDWDVPLRELLESIPDERTERLAGVLRTLREQLERFEGGSVEERAAVLEECRGVLEAMRDTLKLRGFDPAGMLPFMEDATADAPASIPRTPETEQVEGALASYVRLTRRLAAQRVDQAVMRHFFDTYYGGEDAGPVPLLRFYEDYHREHLKEHLGKQRSAELGDYEALKGYRMGNPFGLDFVDGVRSAERALVERVSAKWGADPGAEQIDLSAGELAGVLCGVPDLSDDAASVAAFVEYVAPVEGRSARLVLSRGGYSIGYGKFFSRFLHLFPDRVRDDLLESNRGLSEGFVAEICGDGNHNANLHPPILPREISYPTGESGVAEEQLPATELVVERHPGDARALILRHAPTGQRVVPVDLGFVTPTARPPLFQLLSRFTPPTEFHLRLPDYPRHVPAQLREGPPSGSAADPEARRTLLAEEEAARAAALEYLGSVTYRPRLVFEGAVVLRRRQWVVPLPLLPQRPPDEPALDFFLRANRWREEHGVPREVYARLERTYRPKDAAAAAPPVPAPAEAGDAPAQPKPAEPRRFDRSMLNNLKPQYVDFASPLLVGLFGSIAPEGEDYAAVLVERYPGAESLPEHAGERFAAEQIVQIDVR